MDGSLAIQATNLSKKYRLGTIGITSLREDLSRWWNRGKNEITDGGSTQAGIEHSRMINDHEFWALHDLNFEIPQGEVVGLIGANGSGKSTLLKILSRITEPSEGEVKVRGKVASLLEVGTGFHPELTGRENVYVNGAILGMTRREVDKKFDEIVDFAGVTDFIDTPIKRYSSGMTVRLGFAVAAHLDPDILIVDEVLAVGDLRFQNRCINQMQKIAQSGKTVLFVSHQMATVENLCKSAFLLDRGKIIYSGFSGEVINEYRKTMNESFSLSLKERKREGNGKCKLVSFRITNQDGEQVDSLICGKPATLALLFEVHTPCTSALCLSLGISTANRHRIAHLCMKTFGKRIEPMEQNTFEVFLHLPKVELNQGKYYVTSFLDDESGEIIDWVVDAFELQILESDFYGTGMIPKSDQGVILMEHSFA
ncbi:MAG: ABC transporter ATP-binding protein [Opitutae bacterium]